MTPERPLTFWQRLTRSTPKVEDSARAELDQRRRKLEEELVAGVRAMHSRMHGNIPSVGKPFEWMGTVYYVVHYYAPDPEKVIPAMQGAYTYNMWPFLVARLNLNSGDIRDVRIEGSELDALLARFEADKARALLAKRIQMDA